MAKEHEDGSDSATEAEGGSVPSKSDDGPVETEETTTKEEVVEDGLTEYERTTLEENGLGSRFAGGPKGKLHGRAGRYRRGSAFQGGQ